MTARRAWQEIWVEKNIGAMKNSREESHAPCGGSLPTYHRQRGLSYDRAATSFCDYATKVANDTHLGLTLLEAGITVGRRKGGKE